MEVQKRTENSSDYANPAYTTDDLMRLSSDIARMAKIADKMAHRAMTIEEGASKGAIAIRLMENARQNLAIEEAENPRVFEDLKLLRTIAV